MSNLEELLAGLDSDEQEEQTHAEPQNQSIKKIRDWGNGLEKQLRSATKELEELRTFRSQAETQVKRNQASSVFTEKGLNGNLADLFLRVHEGEITTEAVEKFAADYGFAPQHSTEAQPSAAGTPFGGHSSSHSHGGGFAPAAAQAAAPDTSKQTYTRAEIDSLMRTNPAAAMQAMNSGKVAWNNEVTERRLKGEDI